VMCFGNENSLELYMPNHALKDLEMRYAISRSVKAPMQVDSTTSVTDIAVVFLTFVKIAKVLQ